MKRDTAYVEIKTKKEQVLFCLHGEIDHHAAAPLRVKMDEIILKERPKIVRMDFSGVGMMDSSGIGLIVGRLQTVRSVGGQVILTGATERALRIFHMAGLERLPGLSVEQKIHS